LNLGLDGSAVGHDVEHLRTPCLHNEQNHSPVPMKCATKSSHKMPKNGCLRSPDSSRTGTVLI
jgi:hypothetical protein